MGPITINLWINGHDMHEAADYYCRLFEDGEVLAVVPYGAEAGEWAGAPMVVELRLGGAPWTLINGAGHTFTPSEATSFEVACEDQAEVDRVWGHLADGGRPGPCGWIADRYGFSWQVVPAELGAMMRDPDPERVARVTACFMAVDGVALSVADLRAAYDGS
ncbi:VOC family protein [Nocardioides lentus]|uniref:VOC family protein n=1 Tax=Nocardioides lentus TaxID=338077 RepID=A0ABP5AJU0_9ACTN